MHYYALFHALHHFFSAYIKVLHHHIYIVVLVKSCRQSKDAAAACFAQAKVILTKLNFLTKFPVLEKFVDLMYDQKYEHLSIFPLWGRVKLNFRDSYANPNIFF